MDNLKIGNLIAECRKQKKMTQKELADKLGVTDKSVSKWERGICLPDVSLYMELCNILEISLNEFFLGERIKDKEFKKKADENLLKAIENSSFSLNDRINYFKNKWKVEHRFELILGMIIIIMLLFFTRNNGELFVLVIIGGFIFSINRYNSMMAYIEKHAYKKSDN